MSQQALPRRLVLHSVGEPGGDDFAVDGSLVEVAAAQAHVAKLGDALQQETVRPLERLARFRGFLVRGQRLGVPPPYFLRSKPVRAGETLRPMKLGRLGGRLERSSRVAVRELRLRHQRADYDLAAKSSLICDLNRGLVTPRGRRVISLQKREVAFVSREPGIHVGVAEVGQQVTIFPQPGSRAVDVAKLK